MKRYPRDKNEGLGGPVLPLPEEAFSPDGYIVDQSRTASARYGRYGSDYNGCGWIAAYNLLHRCGFGFTPDDVRSGLEPSLRLRGKFGTFPFSLRRFLRRFLPVSLKICTKKRFEKLSCAPGILLYWTGSAAHNVHFAPCEEHEGCLRLCNAVYGVAMHVMRPAEFFSRYVKFPLALIFTVRPAEPGGSGDTE